ncbi:MAG: hypothetical protein AB2A00_00525 [Myxococcota bacterium]
MPVTVRPRSNTHPVTTPSTTAPTTTVEAPAPQRRSSGVTTDSVENTRVRATGTDATSTTTRVSRTGGVNLRALKPLAAGVEFDGTGLVVGGRSTARQGGVTGGAAATLYQAAAQLGQLDHNPFSAMSATARRQLADHLLPFLMHDRDASARASSSGVQARAAAYAMLTQLAQAMDGAKEGKQLSSVVDGLLAAAKAERNSGLRRTMLAGLDALPAGRLTTEQATLRKELLARLCPPAPPYERWFAGTDKPQFNVRQYVQDEFWKAELSTYRKEGFEVTMLSETKAVATKLLVDPTGKNPPVTARVELNQSDAEVLQEMNNPDVHMVMYTGHSQLGAVGKLSAAHAPREAGEKLVAFFACRTKQNLPALRRELPSSHLLVSNHGTYGHDDRIVIHKIFDGIATRASYAQMEKNAEKEDLWEKNNYIFPHDPIQLHHVDLDGDGRTEVSGPRRDLLFNPDVRSGAGNSISFQPGKRVADASTLDGRKVADAVSWFNTEYFYWAEESGGPRENRRADRFVPDGWFNSDKPDEIVRVEKSNGNGEPVWRVKVNAAYANQDADAVAMMVTFALAQQTMKEVRPNESAYDQRMRALAMVGSYVYFHVEFSDVADSLMKNFAKRFGFPESLTWPLVESAVGADSHAEASEKSVRVYERGMQYPFLEVNPKSSSLSFRTYVQKALDILKESKSEVGRATFEAIATGKVKLDTLSDLTREDFIKLRKEFAKDGIPLKAGDYQTLHDKNSGAMRAIRGSIDGYMWDDRIYVAENLTPQRLAQTLVHEVNHVANASEDHYRSPKDILVEEYRAVYAEALLSGRTPTKAQCRELKEGVIRDYGLTGVSPDDVPDVPPGEMDPHAIN